MIKDDPTESLVVEQGRQAGNPNGVLSHNQQTWSSGAGGR